jgi:hypothetical protein
VTWHLKRERRAQSRTPLHEGARTTPEDGDIVVREEQREGTFVYALHTAPGADQYLLSSRGEAVGQALVSARTHGVGAWLTDGGATSRCLKTAEL